MTVVDAGAYCGLYTLIAARKVGLGGKVYAYEPAPSMFRVLRDNVQVNGLLETGIVELRNIALLDRAGERFLNIYKDNLGHNNLFDPSRKEGLLVTTAALDDELADAGPVDLIKIDAEGAEPLIFKGMSKVIQRSPDIKIIMEFAPSHLRRAGTDPQGFLRAVEQSGFSISRIHDETGELIETGAAGVPQADSLNLFLTRASGGRS